MITTIIKNHTIIKTILENPFANLAQVQSEHVSKQTNKLNEDAESTDL